MIATKFFAAHCDQAKRCAHGPADASLFVLVLTLQLWLHIGARDQHTKPLRRTGPSTPTKFLPTFLHGLPDTPP